MTATLDAPVDTAIPQPGDIARRWLAGFGAALERSDVRGAAQHFLVDGWWRDLLSFTWDLHTTHGRADIESRLADSVPVHEPRHLVLSPAHPPPRRWPIPRVTGYRPSSRSRRPWPAAAVSFG